MTNIPYTYLIGWSTHNKWYYGVRYAKDCNPKDLWVTYFTSSIHTKEFRELNGEPDVISVRKTFPNEEKAKLWEEKVLKRMNVVDDEKWLNKNDRLAPPILWGHKHNVGKKHNKETLEKRSQSIKKTLAIKFPVEDRKKPKTNSFEEYVELHRQNTKNLWKNRSEKDIEELGNKISESLTGKPKTGKVAKGHIKSDEWRKKISESNKKTLSANPEKTAKGKSWWNNGNINTRSKESPGPEWVKGKLPHNKSYNSEKMKEIWALRKAGKLPMPDYGK